MGTGRAYHALPRCVLRVSEHVTSWDVREFVGLLNIVRCVARFARFEMSAVLRKQ
jgi:hypothetical protein